MYALSVASCASCQGSGTDRGGCGSDAIASLRHACGSCQQVQCCAWCLRSGFDRFIVDSESSLLCSGIGRFVGVRICSAAVSTASCRCRYIAVVYRLNVVSDVHRFEAAASAAWSLRAVSTASVCLLCRRAVAIMLLPVAVVGPESRWCLASSGHHADPRPMAHPDQGDQCPRGQATGAC